MSRVSCPPTFVPEQARGQEVKRLTAGDAAVQWLELTKHKDVRLSVQVKILSRLSEDAAAKQSTAFRSLSCPIQKICPDF